MAESLPTVMHRGTKYTLHAFYFLTLPGLLYQAKSGGERVTSNMMAEDLKILDNVLLLIEPVAGKKTKVPYEDALWAGGYALNVQNARNEGGVFVMITDRAKPRRPVRYFVLGGIRGMYEATGAVIADTKAKLAGVQKEQAETGLPNFAPLTTVEYWRQSTTFTKSNDECDHSSSKYTGPWSISRVRNAIRHPSQGLREYDRDLMDKITAAVDTVLTEVAQLQQVYSSGAWAEVVAMIGAGKAGEVAPLLSAGIADAQKKEPVYVIQDVVVAEA